MVIKDLMMLFTDIYNCVKTGNIDTKKLVYLYLINYRKSQLEHTMLALDNFVKDGNNLNLLVHSLEVVIIG